MFQWKTNLFPQRPSPPSYQQQKQDLEQTPTDIINNLFTAESKGNLVFFNQIVGTIYKNFLLNIFLF